MGKSPSRPTVAPRPDVFPPRRQTKNALPSRSLVSPFPLRQSCCGDKTACSSVAINWRGFAIPIAHSSHLAQAIGRAVIQQGYRVIYREAHTLLEELADATLDGTRKGCLAELATVPFLIVDDLGMRKLPHTAAEDLLEIIMRRYERASTLLTSNRPVDDGAGCSATPPPSPPCSVPAIV